MTPPSLVHRRSFLQSGITAAAAVMAGCSTSRVTPKPPIKAVVGTQLYGWGQYYEREGKQLETKLDEALSLIRDGGYDYAEGSLDVARPESNGAFAERLVKAGLRPLSLYTGGAFHVAGEAIDNAQRIVRAAEHAQRAGFTGLVCNPDPLSREKTDEELKTQASALAQLGSELARIGMTLGLHHHTPEFRSNGREYHFNFNNTSAATVGFCYDVHWVYRGGIQPAQALKDYGSRIVSWHLRQSRDQIWWEDLDSGDIDYAVVAAYANRHGIATNLTVELALENGTRVTRSAAENHRRSRQFVQRMFGV